MPHSRRSLWPARWLRRIETRHLRGNTSDGHAENKSSAPTLGGEPPGLSYGAVAYKANHGMVNYEKR
jgi:hypothetical protein